MAKFDETAFNVLIADGLDVPTAYAASVMSPASRDGATFAGPNSFTAGIIFGVLTYWVWLL